MSSSKPRLTYFADRGLAEVIRLALNAAQIEYDEIYLKTREQFLQLITDGKLMFKQVPLLEMDGLVLIGSEPTLRYVCNKYGFQGKTHQNQVMIEMLSMGARDMRRSGISSHMFQATPEKREEMLQYSAKECNDRYLPAFEKVLSESKSGFLVGDSLTMADFMFFDGVSYLYDYPQFKPMVNEEFPKCKAFIEHFSNQPGLKEYLASPRRHPVIHDESVKVAKEVLAWK